MNIFYIIGVVVVIIVVAGSASVWATPRPPRRRAAWMREGRVLFATEAVSRLP